MSKFVQFLASVLAFGLLFSCVQKEELSVVELPQNNTVIIEVEFYNANALDSVTKVGIYAKDRISKHTYFPQVRLDSTAKHRFEFDLTAQQDVSLIYGGIHPVIVSPGDSLYIKIDGASKNEQEVLSGMEITGTATSINEILRKFSLNQPVKGAELQENYLSLNPYDFNDYRRAIYNKQGQYIDSLLVSESFSEVLQNWFKAQKLYALADSYSYYDFYLPPKNEFLKEETNTDQINLLKFNVDSLPEFKDE